jgi:hypothetical protein
MINEKGKEKKKKKFHTVFVMAAMRRRSSENVRCNTVAISRYFLLKIFRDINDLRNIWPKILSDGNIVRRDLQR